MIASTSLRRGIVGLVDFCIRLIEHAYRLCPALLPRPIILLEGAFAHLGWFEMSPMKLRRECYRRGLVALQYRIESEPVADLPDLPLEACHRGVQLFPAVKYQLCMSLEITPDQFDRTNDKHWAEAQYWLAHARNTADQLAKYLTHTRPRAVITIQGHFIESEVVRQLATQFSYQVYVLENCLFPRRMLCEAESGLTVNLNSSLIYFHRHRACFPSATENIHWMRSQMRALGHDKLIEHQSPGHEFAWPMAGKRLLFLAQCFTDASVLFGRHGQFSSTDIVQALLTYATATQACLVVKLHPKENEGENPLHRPYRRLTARRLRSAGLVPDDASSTCYEIDDSNRYSTQKLMQEADVVITINSQAGLEAQALGKEVVLLGNAFYSGLGTCWNIPDPGLLPATLDAILVDGKTRIDRALFAQFLRVYHEIYCVEKSPRHLAGAIRQRSRTPLRHRP